MLDRGAELDRGHDLVHEADVFGAPRIESALDPRFGGYDIRGSDEVRMRVCAQAMRRLSA